MRGLTSDQYQLIREAAAALQPSDIVLVRSVFDRPSVEPESDGETVEVEQQVMSAVSVQESDDEDARRVLVTLGVRMVEAGTEPANVMFVIEATYGIEYRVTGKITDEAMKMFASKNSIHNVWPFWRQHVFDIVQRGNLPKVEVPFFTMDWDETDNSLVAKASSE